MDIKSYYKINKFGSYEKQSFTKEETAKMREEYKLIMREFALKNMDENRPTIFDGKLNTFLELYGRNTGVMGYRRFILKKVFGDKASEMIINEDDGIINLKNKGLLMQGVKEEKQNLKRLPDE
jgi:hypothetical protein